MSTDEENAVLVALLEDAADHMLPRLHGVRRHLEEGGDLAENDAQFFHETLEKLRFCLSGAGDDPECERIFARIAHELYEVVALAGERQPHLA